MATQLKEVNMADEIIPFEENYFGIEWIETEKLQVDDRYQRPQKPAHIATIAENWDWKACRTLAVSLRRGEDGENYYAVIDGQQRLAAARRADIKKLPCQVYLDLSLEKEAELFTALNNSKKPTANDMFRAKLTEGDEEARIIAIAIERTGWRLELNATIIAGRKYNWCDTYVASAPVLIDTYQRGGVNHLMQVLTIAHGWHGQDKAASADVLTGLSLFLHRHHEEITLSLFTEKLALETPNGILGKASQIQLAERSLGQFSSPRKTAVYKVLLSLYNKSLRATNRIEERK